VQEITRTGWFVLGVASMAAAGAVHAVTGAAHIARDMVRPVPAGTPAVPAAQTPVSGRGGWLLFGALILAGGVFHQVFAGAAKAMRELLGIADQR
jgi:hypothetical protein